MSNLAKIAIDASLFAQPKLACNDKEDVVRENADKLIHRDVTSDAHLHYWECADGTTELDSISSSHDQNLP